MTIRRTCILRASVHQVLRLRTSGLRYFNAMLTSVQAAAITDEPSSVVSLFPAHRIRALRQLAPTDRRGLFTMWWGGCIRLAHDAKQCRHSTATMCSVYGVYLLGRAYAPLVNMSGFWATFYFFSSEFFFLFWYLASMAILLVSLVIYSSCGFYLQPASHSCARLMSDRARVHA